MTYFTFDHHMKDNDNKLRIDVTRSQDCDFVQLNILPLARPWPRTTVIISLEAAAELAQTLLTAVQPAAPAG